MLKFPFLDVDLRKCINDIFKLVGEKKMVGIKPGNFKLLDQSTPCYCTMENTVMFVLKKRTNKTKNSEKNLKNTSEMIIKKIAFSISRID